MVFGVSVDNRLFPQSCSRGPAQMGVQLELAGRSVHQYSIAMRYAKEKPAMSDEQTYNSTAADCVQSEWYSTPVFHPVFGLL